MKKKEQSNTDKILAGVVRDSDALKTFLTYIAYNEADDLRLELEGFAKEGNVKTELEALPPSWPKIMEVLNNNICPISMEGRPSGGAAYISKKKTIFIDPEKSLNEIMQSFAFELALAYLDSSEEKYSRQKDAFAAKCISYIIGLRTHTVEEDRFYLHVPEHLSGNSAEEFLCRVMMISNKIAGPNNKDLSERKK